MTDEYVLDQLLERNLRWELDPDVGYVAEAQNGILLYLKGSSESRISLTFLGKRKSKKYTITEPPCPIWKRGKDVPVVKQKLEALLKQAEERCPSKDFWKRQDEMREELLKSAIGWNS